MSGALPRRFAQPSWEGAQQCYERVTQLYADGTQCGHWAEWYQGDSAMSIIAPSIGIAIAITIYRYLFEYIAESLGGPTVSKVTGIPLDLQKPKFLSNAGLSKKLSKIPNTVKTMAAALENKNGEMVKLCSKIGVKRNQVQHYLEYTLDRMELDENLKKYRETTWRLVTYMALVTIGWYCVQEDWAFRDIAAQWAPWEGPFPVDTLNDTYQKIQIGFYLHLLFAQFFDVKRKDFVAMFIHHIVTLWLIGYGARYLGASWRVGTTVVWLHDINDVFMEAAKFFKKSGSEMGANVFFAFFAISWVVTRFYYYPLYCIYSAWCSQGFVQWPDTRIYSTIQMCTMQWNLVLLLVLHVYWFYFILKILFKALLYGEVNDERNYRVRIKKEK